MRNPFARALSGYLDKINGRDHSVYNEVRLLKSVSFVEFLHALKKFKPRNMDGHFRPQFLNLNYPTVTYDAIFYLEHPAAISAFGSKIDPNFRLERFSLHPRGAIEKLTAFYDEATIQLVREIFVRDFELFGYSQNLSDAAVSPGVMIAGDRLVSHESGRLPAPNPDPGIHGRSLEKTLYFRRLMEKRLI